jgi:hypothetical protein
MIGEVAHILMTSDSSRCVMCPWGCHWRSRAAGWKRRLLPAWALCGLAQNMEKAEKPICKTEAVDRRSLTYVVQCHFRLAEVQTHPLQGLTPEAADAPRFVLACRTPPWTAQSRAGANHRPTCFIHHVHTDMWIWGVHCHPQAGAGAGKNNDNSMIIISFEGFQVKTPVHALTCSPISQLWALPTTSKPPHPSSRTRVLAPYPVPSGSELFTLNLLGDDGSAALSCDRAPTHHRGGQGRMNLLKMGHLQL